MQNQQGYIQQQSSREQYQPQHQYEQQSQQQQYGEQVVQYQNQQQQIKIEITQGGGGTMNFGGVLNLLESLPAVYINQQLEFFLADCDCGIKSEIYKEAWAKMLTQLCQQIFKDRQWVINLFCDSKKDPYVVQEDVSCINLLKYFRRSYRPYSLLGHEFQVGVTKANQSSYNDQTVIFKMDRPCAWTFLCCNRPFIDIFDTQNQISIFIGKIVAPFQISDHGVEIYDQNDTLLYVIEASCCQPIFWLNLPCESCSKCKFIVYDASSRQVLTELWKETQGCVKALTSSGDSFRVIFPSNTTKENKALIMAASLFLDYRFFEKGRR